mgnify:CR=1 FL=1
MNEKREDTLLGISPRVVVWLDGLPVAEPVNQTACVVAGDIIDHGAVGFNAVLMQIAFGHVGILELVDDDLVLFGADPIRIVAPTVGGMVLAVVGWLLRWWRRRWCLSRLRLRWR